MSGLITIRIPEDLQSQMKKYKINWSYRIRSYLETQIKQMELLQFLKTNSNNMKHSKIHANSATMIREDRDSR